MRPNCVGSISWTPCARKDGDGVVSPAVKGSWRKTMGLAPRCLGSGVESNRWECLTTWRSDWSPHQAWGHEQGEGELMPTVMDDVQFQQGDSMHVALQGLQPYVNVTGYPDTPFPCEFSGNFGIHMGVDQDFAILFQPKVGMRHACRAMGDDEAVLMHDAPEPASLAAKPDGNRAGQREEMTTEQMKVSGQERIGAPPSTTSEQLGKPRLASCGTLSPSPMTTGTGDSNYARTQQCALLGGGRLDQDDYFILEDEDRMNADLLTPGHLQDRLVVLQQRALEAIQALPAKCREDQDYGMVETRVWGLEALKHILRMRLALQSHVQLTRPVTQVIDMPQTSELLAANLTLTIRNPGNRCYANSVLRMWCWMGAHHDKPGEFWGPSTNLCLQLLQQEDIPDIFWASEIQPVIAKLENPQAQHDASEFMVLLWEHWSQTGMQGSWHSQFGGRNHDFETLPLFIRMPVEAGDGVSFEQLLQEWANEANGQCLAADVQHIVFHVGRYHLCPRAKSWVKHHNRLYIPSTFKCAQRTSTGHGGQATFALRGVIAHQGEELISGHYVTLLVEGDALWSVDDGQCPQAQTAVPDIFQTDAVMIWASRAEHSPFWTRAIGTFERPIKRQKLTGEGIEVFYSNITQ